uniref:Helicase sen1-like n=1 Tax=Dermatophagoides pteronyssinus TaxID=6956 RepID=A0A6P6YJI6_DERPT
PGTGKTRTIIALISLLLLYACKLLVCAPSNAAVDEIMRRLVRPPAEGGGVYDKRGALCAPNVLRLGPGFHNDLRPWTLASALASQNLDRDGAMSLQNSLIERANIICCTLSIAGSSALVNSGAEFDVVIIDEASQGVELSTLIPLRSKCKSMVLVGDPRQLPPTVLSRLVLQMRYNVSLFQRLESLQYRMCLLATQYRMHPVISRFSSEE